MIVRKEGFELTNGSALIATIPKVNGEYDLKTLSELALSLKRDYPDADDASVLLEPDIEYDHLIQVMDAIRSAEVPAAADPKAADPESPVRRSTSSDRRSGAHEGGSVHRHRRGRRAVSRWRNAS